MNTWEQAKFIWENHRNGALAFVALGVVLTAIVGGVAM